MPPQIFLSLSFAEEAFVNKVHQRLPRGLANFYKVSFHNGENLVKAMEARIASSNIFVLFASRSSVESMAVQFELALAQQRLVFEPNRVKLFIFPTDTDVSFRDLPEWMQKHWVGTAGYEAADVARYLTTFLLSGDVGGSSQTMVVGRGQLQDKLNEYASDFLVRHKRMPEVYIFSGLSGIGRRTFSSYYMAHSLSAEANLTYGPTFNLPIQTDIADLYRRVRSEIGSDIDLNDLSNDFESFSSAQIDEQVSEIIRLFDHFWSLGQAVTIYSTTGLFDDLGEPKTWVSQIITRVPERALLVLVTNRHFDEGDVERFGNAVQLTVPPLSASNTRTLMNFTASKLGVENFEVSEEMVVAIGGHAEVANSAVRLVSKKGSHILEKDPAQLFNIQNMILGESLDADVLSDDEISILSILSWVPYLGADLVEEISKKSINISDERFLKCIKSLISSCLIYPNGYHYYISSAIRQIFRRKHPSSDKLLNSIHSVLSEYWQKVELEGGFREDVYESSVFMVTYLGKELPKNLRNLLSPGLLSDLVRSNYDRGKDSDDSSELQRVIALASMSHNMDMSDAVREEILSTQARAQIRLAKYADADETIGVIRNKGYRSYLFLEGHKLRKQEKYELAISCLKNALEEMKFNRAVIHELALCYARLGVTDELTRLLENNRRIVSDSAMLIDFEIALHLAAGDLERVRAGIRSLRALSDDEGRADRREAQLLMKRNDPRGAKKILDSLLERKIGRRVIIRSDRAIAAAWSGDFDTAKRDVEFVKSIPGRQLHGVRLEAELSAAKGEYHAAEALLSTLPKYTPADQLLRAKIFELRAESASTPFSDRKSLIQKAQEIRAQHSSGGAVF